MYLVGKKELAVVVMLYIGQIKVISSSSSSSS